MNNSAAHEIPEHHVSYRPMTADDEAFVYASWLRSVRNESPAYAMVMDAVFFPAHHVMVERCFESSEVIMACLVDDPSVLIGFACGVSSPRPSGAVLHYVYVKSAFRRMGIAAAMLKALRIDPSEGCTVTHWTRFCTQIRQRIPLAVYNPYLLRSS